MTNDKIDINGLIVNGKADQYSIDGSEEQYSEEQGKIDEIISENFKVQTDDNQKNILNDYQYLESQDDIDDLSKSLKNDSNYIAGGNKSDIANNIAVSELSSIQESYSEIFDNQFSKYLKKCDEYENLKESFLEIVIDEPHFAELILDYLKQGQSTRLSTRHHKFRNSKRSRFSYISKTNRFKLDQIRDKICYFATYNHARNNHSLSAHKLLTDAQAVLLIVGSIFLVIIIAQFNNFYGYIAVMISLLFFMLTNIVKLTSIVGYLLKSRGNIDEQNIKPDKKNELTNKKLLSNGELDFKENYPIYSILVPVYKESGNILKLTNALMSIDYPKDRLDVKILMEEDDENSIAIFNSLNLPSYIELIVVPLSMPKTKPKALNFGLCFAKGEFVTIYDAEDIPDKSQLKKAIRIFCSSNFEISCLQAKLDYYNARNNLITKQFTIEYNSLFRVILPGFDKLNLPIPLGGTSNHFVIEDLISAGAWDPFNVTEDADLGYRLLRMGYKTGILYSHTFEEACSTFDSWIKQRSRWIKGWLQTYIVHSRSPLSTISEMGMINFIFFNLLSLSLIVSCLVYPLFYLSLFIIFFNSNFNFLEIDLILQSIIILSVSNFLLAFLISAITGYYGLKEAGNKDLFIHLLWLPLYWFMLTWAAYRAVIQIFVAPFYWDKTKHNQSTSDIEAFNIKLQKVKY